MSMRRAPPSTAEHFHGESGLGALPVFEPAAPLAPGHAVDAIIGHVRREPANSVSIAITGPCTNVAAALLKAPDIAPRLGEVVIMGGARSEGGNITASAEYNIYADPAAADIVLTQAPHVTMLGLDVTHQIRATPARIAALVALGNPRAEAAANLLQFSSEAEAAHGIGGGAPLHDPATILWLLAPHLFSGQRAYIRVETESVLTRGHTQVDFREKDKTNALWLMHADADGCFAVLMERLSR
jgi:purine nucleosidase